MESFFVDNMWGRVVRVESFFAGDVDNMWGIVEVVGSVSHKQTFFDA